MKNGSCISKKNQHWDLHRLQKDNSLTRKQYSWAYSSLQANADFVVMPLYGGQLNKNANQIVRFNKPTHSPNQNLADSER